MFLLLLFSAFTQFSELSCVSCMLPVRALRIYLHTLHNTIPSSTLQEQTQVFDTNEEIAFWYAFRENNHLSVVLYK